LFSYTRHVQHLCRAAARYPAADFIKRQVVEDIATRIGMINRTFPMVLDLGCRSGILQTAVRQQAHVSEKIGCVVEADWCSPMLRERSSPRMVLNPAHWPLTDSCLDLVVATLSLHTLDDLVGCLTRIRASLKPDGLFFGVFYGADTLSELRTALMQAEIETTGAAGMRVAPVLDVRDAGGLLQRAGFALPTADADVHTVRYADMFGLLRDLRTMGETAAFASPVKPLNRGTLARASEIYHALFSDADQRVRATVRTLTLTGWAPHTSQQKPLRPGSAQVGLAEALNGLRND